MANLAIKNQLDNSKLAIAHNAYKKAIRPKRTYSIEDYYDNGAEIEVNFYDKDENFDVDVIERTDLLIFIDSFYKTIIDYGDADFHGQYEDTTSASDYLDNNMRDVLKDFLNNRQEAINV